MSHLVPLDVRFLNVFYPSFESMVVGHCAETSGKTDKTQPNYVFAGGDMVTRNV